MTQSFYCVGGGGLLAKHSSTAAIRLISKALNLLLHAATPYFVSFVKLKFSHKSVINLVQNSHVLILCLEMSSALCVHERMPSNFKLRNFQNFHIIYWNASCFHWPSFRNNQCSENLYTNLHANR